MDRPKNKDEFRAEMANAFTHILEEKGLDWKKEWSGIGGSAPHNGITKANYRGCNAFMLQLTSMIKGYDDPRWVTMLQIMDNDGKYHPKEKWHLKKGSKATYVEYWYIKVADTSTQHNTDIYFGGALYPPETYYEISDRAYFSSVRDALDRT